ncbi:hypothetical protein WN51_09951 [Melipona quadrifasciata]|uniref:Uncharacterized protein n=1 Tax=Melipona quadrifasciata TaxID=166423 RepID=A0A0M9ACG9_9HYME|nr:hypothetical protein WN51_09951 [Melipona quadrifasciata]
MGVRGLLPDSHLPMLLGNKEQTVASDSEGSHLWEPSCTMPCSLDHEVKGTEGKRVDCTDGNEDGKLRASILRKRFNIFLGGLRFAFNPGTTLAYFVVSGAQNTRKTKDNALSNSNRIHVNMMNINFTLENPRKNIHYQIGYLTGFPRIKKYFNS